MRPSLSLGWQAESLGWVSMDTASLAAGRATAWGIVGDLSVVRTVLSCNLVYEHSDGFWHFYAPLVSAFDTYSCS